MKIIISMLMAFLLGTHFAFGAYVLWVGVDENANLDDGYSIPTSFVSWITSAEISGRAGGRIRIGNTTLAAGWEDPPGSKNCEFDNEITDFFLEQFEEDYITVVPDAYADWQPIKIPDEVDPNEHIAIYYDIGYFDDNTEEFIAVATAMSYVDFLYNGDSTGKHIYETGTLAPPIEIPWRPTVYYYESDIPEPSSSSLLILGFLYLFKRKINDK